jgi:hypothetical protein
MEVDVMTLDVTAVAVPLFWGLTGLLVLTTAAIVAARR